MSLHHVKRSLRIWILASVAASPCVSLVHAGNPLDTEPTEIPEEAYEMEKLLPTSRHPKNRFGVQGGVTFGVKAEFVSKAFVGTDVTALEMRGPETVDVTGSRGSAEDDGGFNGEIFYERTLGESDLFAEGVDESWGFHLGVGFSQVEFNGTSYANAFAPLNPGDPPGTVPEFISQGSLQHDLEADLWYVNLGLYKESYLTDRFYAKFGGGLSVAYIEGAYSVAGPFDLAAESAEEEDILIGGYLDLSLGYDFNRQWGIYGGIRYQYLSSFEMETGSSSAELEFDQTFLAFVGLKFQF